MNKRTIVLLVILGAILVVAFFILSREQSSGLTAEVPQREDLTNILAGTFVKPDLREVAFKTAEYAFSLFQAATLTFDRAEADKLILMLPRVGGNYKFLGFVRSGGGLSILLLKDGTKLEIKGETPSFDDYTVAYVSSLGLIVLDTRNGSFYSIR